MQIAEIFHLVISLIMGALMTFVITAVNLGFAPNFPSRRGKAFAIAYVVGFPVIFFIAPLARKLTGKLSGIQPEQWHEGAKAVPSASMTFFQALQNRCLNILR